MCFCSGCALSSGLVHHSIAPLDNKGAKSIRNILVLAWRGVVSRQAIPEGWLQVTVQSMNAKVAGDQIMVKLHAGLAVQEAEKPLYLNVVRFGVEMMPAIAELLYVLGC